MKSNFFSKIGMLCTMTVALSFAGCASKASQKPNEAPKQGSNPQIGQQTGGSVPSAPGATISNCSGQSVQPVNAPGSKLIDGKNMFVTVNDQKTSLCDVLKASGKKVIIVQFAGLECMTCRAEAKATQEGLQASGKSADVLKVIAFTDNKGDFIPEDIQRYSAEFPSPSLAMRANDYGQALWYSLKPNRLRPATLVMNANMESIAVTEFSMEASIVPSAISLLPKN